MKNYFQKWDFMRLIRLAMGVFIVVTGWQMNDWMFVAMGLLFSAMPIFNIGCCGPVCNSNSCQTTTRRGKSLNDEITYKEIK